MILVLENSNRNNRQWWGLSIELQFGGSPTPQRLPSVEAWNVWLRSSDSFSPYIGVPLIHSVFVASKRVCLRFNNWSLSFNFIDKNYRFIEPTVHCLKILIWFLPKSSAAEAWNPGSNESPWRVSLGLPLLQKVQCKFILEIWLQKLREVSGNPVKLEFRIRTVQEP